MKKWESTFAVSADMCMTLQRGIRKAISLLVFHLINFPMNGYVPYAAQAKKSFLPNNKSPLNIKNFEEPGKRDVPAAYFTCLAFFQLRDC